MREFLNSILDFIGTTSLTDEEFETVDLTFPIYDQASYDALAAVLKTRESVSTTIDRLTMFYKAKGVSFEETKVGRSNIFVGAVLS